MSWDVMVMRFEGGTPNIAELESGARAPMPLGPAAEVRQAISRHLSSVDWSDPAWGIYDGDGFSIEFNAGSDDPIDSIMLHVRGGGDAIAAALSFAIPNGWSLLDCSSGDFINSENPSQEGWEGFQDFRDQVLDRLKPPTEE